MENLTQSTPCITVLDQEVPLPFYWQVVDLWTAGYSSDSIFARLVATNDVQKPEQSREVIEQIVYNQELIQRSTSQDLVQSDTLVQNARRKSRIQEVVELDDLGLAQLIARRKEKKKLGLRQLLAKIE